MKTRHEYGNQPEVFSEHDEEVAEEDNFKKDNSKAKAAFLSDQQHDDVTGNATSDAVWAEPPLEGILHTDFIDRRNAAITDRRNVVATNQRIDASQ